MEEVIQYIIDNKALVAGIAAILTFVMLFVEKFREVTLPAMQGKAKAMVVTASRAHAVRYYLAIKAYCEKQGYTPFDN